MWIQHRQPGTGNNTSLSLKERKPHRIIFSCEPSLFTNWDRLVGVPPSVSRTTWSNFSGDETRGTFACVTDNRETWNLYGIVFAVRQKTKTHEYRQTMHSRYIIRPRLFMGLFPEVASKWVHPTYCRYGDTTRVQSAVRY